MNSQFLFEKLENSDEYKNFIKKNPNAYLCSGFFIIDLENKTGNKYHLDFFIPENKKTFCFELENGIKLVPLERNDEQIVMDKISLDNKIDFEKVKSKIMAEMELKKIKNKIQKMIFSLQNKEGKDFLIGTIFISGLGLLKVNVDLIGNIITEFEKKSFFDMMKIIRKK